MCHRIFVRSFRRMIEYIAEQKPECARHPEFLSSTFVKIADPKVNSIIDLAFISHHPLLQTSKSGFPCSCWRRLMNKAKAK
eukprot:TRINITY_DN1119_c0_g1_i1.p1 TRINITY_DN1119_c0_g1~~TRINITY_DN1119_c0_g1_i1.p1  ORF type:complete len:95 (-),score=10.01 TRINITY_DN1119_c0_g1_i1:278-520(-)